MSSAFGSRSTVSRRHSWLRSSSRRIRAIAVIMGSISRAFLRLWRPNLFLWPSRSFFRKALEFPLALWLDRVLGKRRVLEIYLNIAEWGPNGEFGIEAAARRAFGKSAADLDAHEAALLAAVLPNPHRRDARQPGVRLGRLAAIYRSRAATFRGVASCILR